MTKDEAVIEVMNLMASNAILAGRAEAEKLVEIGMKVKAKVQPVSELFEEEEKRIEWTPEQRAVADAALVREREKFNPDEWTQEELERGRAF